MSSSKNLDHKLRRLKKTSNDKNRKISSFFSKSNEIHRFFITVTVVFLVVAMTTATLGRVSQVYQRANEKNTYIQTLVEDFFKVAGTLEEETEEKIVREITSIMEPIDSLWLRSWLTEREITKFLNLLKKWKVAINPLRNYEISSGGVQGGVSTPTFSAALESVFTEFPDLIRATYQYWRSLWLYRLSGLLSVRLRELFKNIEKTLKLLEHIYHNRQNILTLLGHYTTQTIVLFNQNPGEARPTGGFTGSYIIMEISQGELSIKESQSIYFVSNVTPERIVAHPHTWMYSFVRDQGALPHGLHNLNYFPCFEDSARLLAREFERSVNGFTINQLYMITPNILQALLPPDFVLEVPGVGTFNTVNLLDEIERLSSFEAVDITNPKKQIKNIFSALIDNFEQILKYFGTQTILEILTEGVLARHIQTWYPQLAIQDFIDSLGFSSQQVCNNKNPNTVTFLLSNMSGDKRQLITDNIFSIFSQRIYGGHRVTFVYQQFLDRVEFLQRGFNPFGVQFFGFQIPPTATNIEVAATPQSDFPELREYYRSLIKQNTSKDIQTPEVIERTVQSVSPLAENSVLYQQPDGSLVAGSYISDREGETKLEVSFDIPKKSYEVIAFYPQPGMNNPVLQLGNNTANRNAIFQRRVDGLELEKGVDVVLF